MRRAEDTYMNILHMKYAVEVAKLGSLNKAAETLMIAQPNISRSIKELEADLGITIFQRSAKGMFLTPDGEEFINHARDVCFMRIENFSGCFVCCPITGRTVFRYLNGKSAVTTGKIFLRDGVYNFCFFGKGQGKTLDFLQWIGYSES